MHEHQPRRRFQNDAWAHVRIPLKVAGRVWQRAFCSTVVVPRLIGDWVVERWDWYPPAWQYGPHRLVSFVIDAERLVQVTQRVFDLGCSTDALVLGVLLGKLEELEKSGSAGIAAANAICRGGPHAAA